MWGYTDDFSKKSIIKGTSVFKKESGNCGGHTSHEITRRPQKHRRHKEVFNARQSGNYLRWNRPVSAVFFLIIFCSKPSATMAWRNTTNSGAFSEICISSQTRSGGFIYPKAPV